MIEELERDNIEQRKKIEDEAWVQIDEIKNSNKIELTQIIAQGMENKADLMTWTGLFKSASASRETFLKNIKEKSATLRNLDQAILELKNQIENQKGELASRAATIEDKDARIIELKKKTQELEKFKFVLDYKIKELKHKIGPREKKIQGLNEKKTIMQNEVKHFEVVNKNLQLIVEDLKDKLEGLQMSQKKIQDQIQA